MLLIFKNFARGFAIFLLSFQTLLSGSLSAQITLPSGVPSGSNIILWLSPDTALYRPNGSVANVGQRVDKWHDISGNGFVFDAPTTGDRPRLVTVNGFNYLDFTSGDFLENIPIRDSINNLTEFSIFIVIKSDLTNTDHGFLDTEDPNGTDDKICLRYDANGANTGRVNLLKSGLGGNTPNQQVETQNNTQTTDRQILTITWSINNHLKVYIDGTLNDSSANPISNAISGINKVILGKGPKDVNTGDGWDGKIGSIIFFKEEFSLDTINSISQTIQTVKSVRTGNWNTASTWDCACVPSASNNVEISSGHTVSLTNARSLDNLFINSGGVLEGGNSSLTLDGDWNNQGSFIPGNTTVIFSGSSAQFIKGNTTFRNIQLNNSSGLSLTAGITRISGSLQLTSGTLNTNGKLVLQSNASGTGRISAITSGSINGNVTVERYIDAGSTNWRFFSSPISNATLQSLNDDFITSGFTGSDFPSFPFVSIYNYDETAGGDRNQGYIAASNITNSMPVGRGFMAWSGDTINGTQPFTVDFTGPVNTGNITLPVSYTLAFLQPFAENGWNLVGNPYPSAIDWNSASWTKTNIANAIYIWNPDLSQYSSFVNGTGTNGGSRYIASSQAFWVQATTISPQLRSTENVKTTIDQAFLKLPAPAPSIRIGINGRGMSDETVLLFEDDATAYFDSEIDARKLHSTTVGAPSIFTTDTVDEYSINSLPQLTDNISIPIKTVVDFSDNYDISISDELMGHAACVILEDRLSNSFHEIDQDTTFSFYISDTTTQARFYLHLGAHIQTDKTAPICLTDSSGSIVIKGNGSGPWDYEWRSADGTLIRNSMQKSGPDSLVNLPAGRYFYSVSNNGLCGTISDSVIIKSESNLMSSFNYEIDSLVNSLEVKFRNQSVRYSSLEWQFGDGNGSIVENPVHIYEKAGSYQVTLIATDDSACRSIDNQAIELKLTHTPPNPEENGVTIFSPNPVKDFVKLGGNYKVEILDINGRKIEKYKDVNQLNLQHLPAGSYFMILNGRDIHRFEKI